MRPLLDEAWYVEMDEDTRLEWLIQRHIDFGKTPDAARAWVMRSDQANAAVVAATRERADVIVRLASLAAIMPAPTVSFVPSSMRTNAPVTRLAA